MSNDYFIPNGKIEIERLGLLHEILLKPCAKLFYDAGFSKNHKSNISVIDVGCGLGHMTYWAAQKTKASVWGLDNDPEKLTYAKQNNQKNIFFQNYDIREEPTLELQADIVYCRFTLHHLENPIQAIKHLSKLLKPQGTLILGEPVIHHPWVYPECKEYLQGWDLIHRYFEGTAWDPHYGKKLLLDVHKTNLFTDLQSSFYPLFGNTKKIKKHFILLLKSLSDNLFGKNLITKRDFLNIINQLEKIVESDATIFNSFGAVLVKGQKV